MDTLWGSFSDLSEEEEEGKFDKAKDEGLSEEELEELAEKSKKDIPNDEEDKVEKQDPKEDPEKDEKVSDEVDEITKTLESVSDLLEKESLLFLDEDKQYTADSKGFAKMMRDNMEGQRKALEEEFKSREASIRREYDKANTPEYDKMDVENDSHAKTMLEEYYKSTGLDDEEIKEKLEILKDTDTVSKEAKIAQRFLVKRDAEKLKKEQELADQAALEEEKAVAEYIESLKAEIDSTEEMAGFELTNKLRKEFKSYLFDKDKDGLTEAQKAGKDPKRRLRIAWMDFMDYNKKDFEIKAKTEVSKELKKKTSRFTNKNAEAKGKTIEVENDEEGFKPGFADFWSPAK